MDTIKNRTDFIAVISATKANPNGDPLVANSPRQDLEGYGLISDVCIKRKIRNRVAQLKDGEEGFDIFIRPTEEDDRPLATKAEAHKYDRKHMCEAYWDIRAFGAVLTRRKDRGKSKRGQNDTETEDAGDGNQGIRGPVTIQWARSIAQIDPTVSQITRCCVANEEEKKKGKVSTMGTKNYVEHAVYKVVGSVNPFLAKEPPRGTGFTDTDLEVLKEAMTTLFENDESSARPLGSIILENLVFISPKQNEICEPAYRTFERLKVAVKEGITSPTSMEHYSVTLDEDGVNTEKLVWNRTLNNK